MRRSTKTIIIGIGSVFLTISLIITALLGIRIYFRYQTLTHPVIQHNAIWATKDGKIEIDVTNVYNKGSIQTDGGQMEVIVSMSPMKDIVEIYDADEWYQAKSENGDSNITPFAIGEGHIVNKEKYIVIITHAEKYFDFEEQLVFYKVEKDR